MPDTNGARLVNEPPATPPADKPLVVLVEEDDCVVLDPADLTMIEAQHEEIASQLRFVELILPMTARGSVTVIRHAIEGAAEILGIPAPRWGRP